MGSKAEWISVIQNCYRQQWQGAVETTPSRKTYAQDTSRKNTPVIKFERSTNGTMCLQLLTWPKSARKAAVLSWWIHKKDQHACPDCRYTPTVHKVRQSQQPCKTAESWCLRTVQSKDRGGLYAPCVATKRFCRQGWIRNKRWCKCDINLLCCALTAIKKLSTNIFQTINNWKARYIKRCISGSGGGSAKTVKAGLAWALQCACEG